MTVRTLHGQKVLMIRVHLTLTNVLCVCVGGFCSLVVGVPDYTTEMYCAPCEVRTEFIYVL
jgi:hypothetical protein